MTANVGTFDRALRFVVGAALIVAPPLNFMGLGAISIVAYGLMAVGAILALTAIVGLCPLYSLLGVSTRS